MKKNALLIGCGNIGALYDFENDAILTHAKALYLSNKYNLFFYDVDKNLSEKASKKYGECNVLELTDSIFNSADWVSLCTPTNAHFNYLKNLITLNNKFILCEKPVSYNLQEIEFLKNAYKKSNSKVFVNYIRRFQPAYIEIKKKYSTIFDLNKLKECSIIYSRGFINNASHAFDLLEFLFDKSMDLINIIILDKKYDYFQNDPTISLKAKWEHANIVVKGYPNENESIFQMKLKFDEYFIEFLNKGDEIIIVDSKSNSNPLFYKNGCLTNYMQNVVTCLININISNKSNFESSLHLNEKMLNIISC